MIKTVIGGLLGLGIFLVVNIDSSYSNTINNSHIEEENSNQQVASETLSTDDNVVIAQIQENLETHTRNVRPRRPRYITASWYRHGRITANGERFDPNGLTVAHKRLPFNTMIRFINPENGSSIIVRVNDRGPYIRGRDFDLSVRSAQLLGFYEKGVARLDMEIIN